MLHASDPLLQPDEDAAELPSGSFAVKLAEDTVERRSSEELTARLAFLKESQEPKSARRMALELAALRNTRRPYKLG